MLQRRQILKMLGISATALTLSPAAHADLLDWFKGNDRPKPHPAPRSPLRNRPNGKTS
jgi:sulfoxide reductase catalytic subunit YedY